MRLATPLYSLWHAISSRHTYVHTWWRMALRAWLFACRVYQASKETRESLGREVMMAAR